MPVQSRALPYMLAKRDLMVQSRTGSGKTGAFLLPILDRFDPEHKACQALILVPTRELARQVLKEAERLAGPGGMRPVAVYGGVAYGPQIEAFERGAPLVVGTPGRVLDHLLKRTLTLEGLRILVLDEADRMLSMGFYPDMQRLKEYMPKRAVSGYMFSATFPATVKSLAMEFLTQPDFLSLSRDRVHVAGTVHGFYDVPAMEKDRILMRIIEMENPSSAIIFCNTKVNVRYVSVVLKRFGYDAGELSSALNQNAREKVLDRVRSRKLRFLVATDVAARGIDILELSHVIQYEPPKDSEDYIHRVGRTSRAGAIGEALTLVSGLEKIQLQSIARTFGIDLQERPAPTEEDVEAIVAQRATTLLEARLRDRSAAQVERMQRFVPLARSLGRGRRRGSRHGDAARRHLPGELAHAAKASRFRSALPAAGTRQGRAGRSGRGCCATLDVVARGPSTRSWQPANRAHAALRAVGAKLGRQRRRGGRDGHAARRRLPGELDRTSRPGSG